MKKIATILIAVLITNQLASFAQDAAPTPFATIDSFSPTELTPEASLTITGTNFGDSLSVSNNEICFGAETCYATGTLNNLVTSWSNTAIQMTVPADLPETSNPILVKVLNPVTSTYEYIESSTSYTIATDTDPPADPPAPDPAPSLTPTLTSFSPTLLKPGESTVTITGTNFGSSYNSATNQICFSQTCLTNEQITTNLTGWSDTQITVLLPDPLDGPGKITLKIGDTTLASTNSFRLLPKITNVSPLKATTNETVLTITGYEFGDTFDPTNNQICFNLESQDLCFTEADVNNYLVSWTNTEVQVLTPSFAVGTPKVGLVLNLPTTETYGIIRSDQTVEVALPPDPTITGISPTTIVPGETVITINGTGFESAYKPGYHQICFNEKCISNTNINNYLQVWSDTQIQIRAPGFITEDSSTISLKLLHPSTGFYQFIDSPAFTTLHAPVIEWYYTQMDQNTGYTITGQHFGTGSGNVFINGKPTSINSWSDTSITFTVPSDATSGTLYIETANSLKSQELEVQIVQNTIYSSDALSKLQWHLGKINIQKAWEITEGDPSVTVAVIDSGVDVNHEDLKHSIWKNPKEIAGNGQDDDANGYIDDVYGWDFVQDNNNTTPRGSHGTMVASMIAAKKDNGVGIAGIAPNVTIMALNVSTNGEVINVDAAAQAIKYAVDNGADIINLSFGGTGLPNSFQDVVNYAYNNNVMVIAATGNEDMNIDNSFYTPVCLSNVIGVTATDENNKKASFANYGGTCTDFAAPGTFLPLAIPESDGNYAMGDGTSFAAPLIAGLAALVKSLNPNWNVEEIKEVMFANTLSIDNENPGYAGKLGLGIPDAAAILTAAKPVVTYAPEIQTTVEIEETNAEIVIKVPEPEVIKDEPEPTKNESTTDEATEEPADNPQDQTTPTELPTELSISPLKSSFPDVDGYKYANAIAYLESKGIIHGYPDGTFKPHAKINRAEFTKIMVAAFLPSSTGENCFPDVQNQWFSPYVCTAQLYNIISGYADGFFRPENNINTVEALRILIETANINLTGFDTTEWYTPYVQYAMTSNLGFILEENLFATNISRGQMAEMIYQMIKTAGENPDFQNP